MPLISLLDPFWSTTSGLAWMLGLLFLGAFFAATLLPLPSEVWLASVVVMHPEALWLALGLAIVGNVLGSLTTFALGGLLARRYPPNFVRHWQLRPQAQSRMQQWGPLGLLAAWVPVLGDALVLAAGWLRLPFWPCLAWLSVGKSARYVAVSFATLGLLTLG